MPKYKFFSRSNATTIESIISSSRPSPENIVMADPGVILAYIDDVVAKSGVKIKSELEYRRLKVLCEAKEVYPDSYGSLSSGGKYSVAGYRVYTIFNGEPELTQIGVERVIVLKPTDFLEWIDALFPTMTISIYLPRVSENKAFVTYVKSQHEHSFVTMNVTDFMSVMASSFPDIGITVNNDSSQPKCTAAVKHGGPTHIAMTLSGIPEHKVMRPVNEKTIAPLLGNIISWEDFNEQCPI